MRRSVVIACLALAALAAPAEARPRALIAYLPTEPAPRHPLLYEFAGRGMAFGLLSPTLGGYTKRQMALDVGQGARISTRAYDDPVPTLALRGRRIENWGEAVRRAEAAPGEAVPGLLAATAGRVAYSGVIGFEQLEAISAADRAGRIDAVALSTFGTFVERTLALWRDSDLLVARLPGERRGLKALDRLLAAAGPEDLVIALRAPPGGGLRLLPVGVWGGGLSGGRITSPTTRLDGFVAAPDIAPTVLEHLGLDVPERMNGRAMEDTPGGDPDEVVDLSARFDVVIGRRLPTLRTAFWTLGALLLVLVALRRREGARTWLRLTLLAAMWLPGMALVSAALRPSAGEEAALVVLGSVALAAVTDRLLPWPRGPALPALVVMAAHTVDLAFGSLLVDTSLAGPNPRGGARFYGIGNELETVLAVTVLVGAGAWVARRSGPPAARAIAAAAIVSGVIVGAGRLGADVGGVITLGAGGAAAVVAALAAGGRLTRRALAIAVLAPVLALAALVAVDLATGGGAHLTRSVIEADEPGDLVDIVERRFRISFGGIASGTAPVSVGFAVLLLIAGGVLRRRLLEPLEDAPGLRAAVIGAWFATVVGALANDSGPVIVLIGTCGLLLTVGYAHGRPVMPDG